MSSLPKSARRKRMHERAEKDPRYNGRTWRKHRAAFLATHPLCVQCGDVASVVDHITPMRLVPSQDFYDAANHQPLCASCHNSKSASETHKGRYWGGSPQGNK
jgi:5-methylcytosine-specific restriction protein A